METTGNKSRTPSRCREWERNRRNKFNDAISRLGEAVSEVNKLLFVKLIPAAEGKDGSRVESGAKEVENSSKVEIVERAIVCLTTCLQERAQLKAEILALQVEVDTDRKRKENRKDVSTQVFIGISKKNNKSDKYVKVLMLRKSKRSKETAVKETTPPKLPTLLPKANSNDKKGPDNTIVVLPAAPYIFQQRPLLLPTVPPAFVLVDQNIQTLTKPSFPVVNRGNSDITRTTMVNILPIAAYSRPLSASKTKKTITKTKLDSIGKVKKHKITPKNKKQIISESEKEPSLAKNDDKDNQISVENTEFSENSKPAEENTTTRNEESQTSTENKETNVNKDVPVSVTTNTISTSANCEISKAPNKHSMKSNNKEDLSQVLDTPKPSANITTEKSTTQKSDKVFSANSENKTTKSLIDKVIVEKDKENKIPTLLDTSLCESGVDGGNARLELAEEFLAASPTAAFLMSFPLVSGNRADSPAEEPPSIPVNTKDNNQRRNQIQAQSLQYFDKPTSDIKTKPSEKSHCISSSTPSKISNSQVKYVESHINKSDNAKPIFTTTTPNVPNETPFLNLPMPSLLPTTCTLSDSTFGLDFDCNISKAASTQSSTYASNSNLFYKSDPFNSVKNTIYSTSNISSGHEYNSFGLYPCAMEKYSSKNKSDFPNVEENFMKIGSSRLTYDIDLGWSHKSFDFVTCTTTSNTFSKDNILTTASSSYTTSYNPFNPDFHVPLVSNSTNKKDCSSKPISSFSDTIPSFYSQPTNVWSEDVPFYTSSNVSKTLGSRQQNYLPIENTQTIHKQSNPKHFESKNGVDTGANAGIKPAHTSSTQQASEKYKKSPSKMHINWMTSEVRPMQSNVNLSTHIEMKETHNKGTYNQIEHNVNKKQNNSEYNYFPISMHNFPSQAIHEDMQIWPSTRPAGTAEITIEPPPINLPTLVGDLALGPHDKKKNADISNRGAPQNEIQNCNNFFSVTQLMNRSTDSNIPPRYPAPNTDAHKLTSSKSSLGHVASDSNRKTITHPENHIAPPCYVFNDPKSINSYESMTQFSQNKAKIKSDKSSKTQKNSYSAEALIRGGTCNPKGQDNTTKFMIPPQKYNDFNTQDTSVAQVSHFPQILDYSDTSYTGQQFSGTNLYNTTTNTISNSFYSNFMTGSSNLMTGNYSTPFSGDFIDYNQNAECSYPNHKYSDLKMRNNATMFQQEKTPNNYKSSKRESATKHKLECSKKDGKKCQNKRAKLNTEPDDWSDASHLLWQNKTPSKRHPNLSEELAFPNYVGNQVAAGQYQTEFFNSHIMTSNMQPVGHNVDRSLTLPVTSRANFNLSTIFPEITMKVQ